MVELSALLEAVPGASPAGPSLVDDVDMSLLRDDYERLIGQTDGPVGGPAVDDWRELSLKAQDLLEKSKNLELAFYWACGRLVCDGVEGLTEGLVLIRQLCNQYWPDLHPQLRPGDPVGRQRQNWLNDLASPRSYLRILSEQPVFSADGESRVTFRDVAFAADLRKAPEGMTPRSAAELVAAFADAKGDESNADVLTRIQAASRDAAQLGEDFKKLTGGQGTLQLEPLCRLLDATVRTLEPAAAAASLPVNGSSTQNGSISGSGNAAPAGVPAGLDSARQQLRQVIAFFERTEPSSPVPLILKRAEQLIGKNFMDCLEDLGGSADEVKKVFESSKPADD